jgi:hypothetical protein
VSSVSPSFVIAGLDPAIHGEWHQSMDHRGKPNGAREMIGGSRFAIRHVGCFEKQDHGKDTTETACRLRR